jgi:hypothetical protein
VPSQAEIRWKCSFTLYERGFPEESDNNANDVDSALNTGGGFGGVTDMVLSCRTIVTCT